jgi:hypothetical protein
MKLDHLDQECEGCQCAVWSCECPDGCDCHDCAPVVATDA